jgi:hypothetical protein
MIIPLQYGWMICLNSAEDRSIEQRKTVHDNNPRRDASWRMNSFIRTWDRAFRINDSLCSWRSRGRHRGIILCAAGRPRDSKATQRIWEADKRHDE